MYSSTRMYILNLVLNLVFQYLGIALHQLYYTVYLCLARNNKIKYFQTLGVGTNERAARGHKSELKNEGLAKF